MVVYGITFDHTTNYGSCFQAYALQTAIERIGTEVDGTGGGLYQLIPIHMFKDFPVKKNFKNFVIKPAMAFHRLRFKNFEKKYMKFADVDRMSQLETLNQKGDAFVCGSDVIWSSDFNDNVDAFYLNFARKYKFSYAASFGKAEIDVATYNKIQKYLKSFQSVSVREKSSAEVIRKGLGINAELVADPVLLLTRSEWCQLVPEHIECKAKPYIFVYTTHLNSTIQRFIAQLKKQVGMKVITATCGPKQAMKQGIVQVQTPERWLELLRDAEYVITNSFHATAFSVLFHKKFFTVVHGEKTQGINIRMNDFLREIALEDRIYSSVPSLIETGEIDYEKTDQKIEMLRKASMAFLRGNLEEAYKHKISI